MVAKTNKNTRLKRTDVGIIGGLFIFITAFTGIFYYHTSKEKLLEIIFLLLPYIVIPTLGALMIYVVTDGRVNLLLQLLATKPGLKDDGKHILIGSAVGILFATMAIHPSLFQSILPQSMAGAVVMDTTVKHAAYSTIVTEEVSLGSNILALFLYNVFNIGVGEEMLMLISLLLWTWIISNLLKRKYSNDFRKADATAMMIAFIITIIQFNLYHYFVWGARGGLYYVSGAIGRSLFNFLFIYYGFLAAVFAHGVYDFVLTMYFKTGTPFLLSSLSTIVVIGYMIYYGYKYKQNR